MRAFENERVWRNVERVGEFGCAVLSFGIQVRGLRVREFEGESVGEWECWSSTVPPFITYHL
ncbi:hypothetical protein CQ046_14145 [Chryseobacterium sp. MYb7]|nr:hypothetical protein CQ046_14145 [Chryseobacterium sp. MYb7]